jgi:putative DNA primase/helicase
VHDLLTPLHVAKHFVDSGLNVIPLRTDGSKSPRIRWKAYTQAIFPWSEAVAFFDSAGDPSGIGIICGGTSGDLEVIDFDAIECFVPWATAVCSAIPKVLQQLPIIATPDNGRHVYYRCEEIAGNQILAQDEAAHILIETRGQGGLVVAPGSPLETHPTGRPYRVLRGNLSAVPRIEPFVRQHFLNVARTFNKFQRPIQARRNSDAADAQARPNKELIRELYGELPGADMGDRPGDIFNKLADWADILEPHGWTIASVRGETTYWRKPGRFGSEHHATTNNGGADKLYIFSTALEEFEPGHAYTKFYAYTMLNHSGCFTSAAKALLENKFNKFNGGPCTKTN